MSYQNDVRFFDHDHVPAEQETGAKVHTTTYFIQLDPTMESSDNKATALLHHGQRRIILVFLAGASTFLYVGAFFGWGPMQLLLEENGAFDWKCWEDEQAGSTENHEICGRQTNALINVQFIAQTICPFVSPVVGEIADRYGAKMNVYLMTIFMWLGLISLVLASQYRWDRLLYMAFIMIGLGMENGVLLTFKTAMLYSSDSVRRRIIVLLNCLLDAGSVTYLLLWKISQAVFPSSQDQAQHALTKISAGYLFISLFIFGPLAYLWTVTDPEPEKYGMIDESAAYPEKKANLIETEIARAGSDLTTGTSDKSYTKLNLELTESEMVWHSEASAEVENGLSSDPVVVTKEMPSSSITAPIARYIPIADRTPFQQLTSGPALLLAIFFPIHVTAYTWSITTTRDFLAHLGDDELDNKYLTIFTLIMPASLLALPLVDATVSRFGYAGGFYAINLLAVGYSTIRLASVNLNVQVVGFILFAFYCCFLFGIVMSFLPVMLAESVTGKASGFLYMLAGFVSLVNLPMANLATQHFDGDFFWPNLVYTLLLLPCSAAAWGLARAIQRESAAKVAAIPAYL